MSRKPDPAEQSRRKFLVVVDSTPECERAIYFAARTAAKRGAVVKMIAVAESIATGHEWLGVADLATDEEMNALQIRLDEAARECRDVSGLMPELEIRSGVSWEQVRDAVSADPGVAYLVLASSSRPDDPGPLITSLIGRGSLTLPVPIIVIPGEMSDERIEALI